MVLSMSAFSAELLGTMLLILLGGGVVAGSLLKSSKGEGTGWVMITAGWGLAVALPVYAVGPISGGHFNPAVSVGLAAIGEFPWADVPSYIIAQMIGAILGAVLVYILFLPHWKGTEDPDLKLSVFSTMPAIRHPLSNLSSEIIGTAFLVIGILGIGGGIASSPDEIVGVFKPFLVGLLIFAIGLSLGTPTGYAINPARDLGPRIAHFLLPIPGKRDSDWSYAWIPIVGPIIGGVFGAAFYRQLFTDYSGSSVIFWVSSIVVLAIFAGAQLTIKNVKDN